MGAGGPGLPLPRPRPLQGAGQGPAGDTRRARAARRRGPRGAAGRPAGPRHCGRGAGPAQASLQHPQEDAGQGPAAGARVRPAGPARDRRQRGRLLRRTGPAARGLHAGAWRVRRLHRQAQAQRLPIAAHGRDRRRWSGDGGAGAHARHARACRAWCRRPLGLQGGRRARLCRCVGGGRVRGAGGPRAQGRVEPAAGLGARRGACRRRGRLR
mmetsp:Transcript_21668/g.84374  ORF Transcript_21668/g.84374 Transcript_21668/m.84374 type:complete len:212 (-) Transcript_21668:66-701(-)